MSRRRILCVASALLLLCAPTFAYAETSIEAWSSHIELKPNGSAVVQEEIVYNFGDDGAEHHGIYRNIPLVYTLPGEYDERMIEISSIMVTDGQGNLRMTKNEGGGNYLQLKIGDPDVLVSGRQLYVIHYTVWGAINQEIPGKDEFYWNVTGNGWKEWIMKVRTDVVLPLPLNEQKVSSACYFGPQGSTERCAASSTPQEGTGVINSVRFSHDGILRSKEGMSVAVGIPKGIFLIKPASPIKKLAGSVGLYHWWRSSFFGFSALIPIIVFIIMFRIWATKGRDPKGRGTIVTEYDAPEQLTALETAYLLDNNLPPKAISAAIVDLAIRGYLTIERTVKKVLFVTTEDFRMTFLHQTDTTKLSGSERILYDALREYGDSFLVSSLAHKLTSLSAALSKELADDLTQKGYYEENPQLATRNYVLAGIALLFIGFFIPFLNFALVVSGVIVIVFGALMSKRTEHGALVHDEIEGFKQYLSVAEKDRIDFANAPEKDPKIFERYLPYAMVFGVEKAWAGKFADMYTEKDSAHWYRGGGAGFNATALAGSMAAFNTSTASAFTASGGGSGGGGFSGGGAGGGGGGSW